MSTSPSSPVVVCLAFFSFRFVIHCCNFNFFRAANWPCLPMFETSLFGADDIRYISANPACEWILVLNPCLRYIWVNCNLSHANRERCFAYVLPVKNIVSICWFWFRFQFKSFRLIEYLNVLLSRVTSLSWLRIHQVRIIFLQLFDLSWMRIRMHFFLFFFFRFSLFQLFLGC